PSARWRPRSAAYRRAGTLGTAPATEDAPDTLAGLAWKDVFTVSLATLTLVAAGLMSTSTDALSTRALLALSVGSVDTLLAWYVARVRGSDDRAAVLAGQGLGLFAAAGAFALSGASVTVLWAVLAVVAAALAARTLQRGWLYVATALFAAALLRAVAVDVV